MAVVEGAGGHGPDLHRHVCLSCHGVVGNGRLKIGVSGSGTVGRRAASGKIASGRPPPLRRMLDDGSVKDVDHEKAHRERMVELSREIMNAHMEEHRAKAHDVPEWLRRRRREVFQNSRRDSTFLYHVTYMLPDAPPKSHGTLAELCLVRFDPDLMPLTVPDPVPASATDLAPALATAHPSEADRGAEPDPGVLTGERDAAEPGEGASPKRSPSATRGVSLPPIKSREASVHLLVPEGPGGTGRGRAEGDRDDRDPALSSSLIRRSASLTVEEHADRSVSVEYFELAAEKELREMRQELKTLVATNSTTHFANMRRRLEDGTANPEYQAALKEIVDKRHALQVEVLASVPQRAPAEPKPAPEEPNRLEFMIKHNRQGGLAKLLDALPSAKRAAIPDKRTLNMVQSAVGGARVEGIEIAGGAQTGIIDHRKQSKLTLPSRFIVTDTAAPSKVYFFAYDKFVSHEEMARAVGHTLELARWAIVFHHALIFNKKGHSRASGGLPNMGPALNASVEGSVYLLNEWDLKVLEGLYGSPRHYVKQKVTAFFSSDPQLALASHVAECVVFVAAPRMSYDPAVDEPQAPLKFVVEDIARAGSRVFSPFYLRYIWQIAAGEHPTVAVPSFRIGVRRKSFQALEPSEGRFLKGAGDDPNIKKVIPTLHRQDEAPQAEPLVLKAKDVIFPGAQKKSGEPPTKKSLDSF